MINQEIQSEAATPHQHRLWVVISEHWAIRFCSLCSASWQLPRGGSPRWLEIGEPLEGEINKEIVPSE